VELKPKRYRYETSVRWTGEHRGTMSAAGKADVEVACPPEFGGEGGFWSPEDLFVSSINVCVMTTFVSLAERQKVELVSYESEADALATIVGGELRFVTVTVRPRIYVRDERSQEEARQALERARSLCMVTLSVRPEVRIEADIRLANDPHAAV